MSFEFVKAKNIFMPKNINCITIIMILNLNYCINNLKNNRALWVNTLMDNLHA